MAVFTDESISIILSGELDHIHETNVQKLERQILRTACKRKAVDMISERPSKIINSILLMRHLFVQAMGIICANKIDIHLRHCYKFIVLL
jgi:hypothetical protein